MVPIFENTALKLNSPVRSSCEKSASWWGLMIVTVAPALVVALIDIVCWELSSSNVLAKSSGMS